MRRLLRILFLVFDGLLIVLFVLGYAARYVHPRHGWWLQVVALGLPYVSLLLLGGLPLVALQRRWKLLGGHVLVALLLLVRFVPVGRGGRPAVAPEALLSVMTFNAGSGVAAGPGLRAVERLIAQERPHLIALQEQALRVAGEHVWLAQAPPTAVLFDTLGYTTRLPDPSLSSASETETVIHQLEQPVLSRILLEAFSSVHGQGTSIQGTPAAPLTRVRIQWQGRTAVLYNVHLHSFTIKPWREEAGGWSFDAWQAAWRAYRKDFLIRASQVEEVRRILAQEHRPFIICGDLNSTPHNWAYARLSKGLRDTFAAAGRGWGATYPAHRPLLRIDFVFVSDAFHVQTARVVRVASSDHRPLLVSVAWRDD